MTTTLRLRVVLGCWVIATACSSPKSSGGGGRPIPIAHASTDATPVAVTETPFREFVAPPPLADPGPATPASKSMACGKPIEGNAEAHEELREVAALDRALRTNASMLLPARRGGGNGRGRLLKPGTIVRGDDNARWMVVGQVACGWGLPLVAMTADHEVFIPIPNLVARQTWTVQVCESECRGCGMESPPMPVSVEVPADARFGQSRPIKVPIDVRVKWGYERPGACPP